MYLNCRKLCRKKTAARRSSWKAAAPVFSPRQASQGKTAADIIYRRPPFYSFEEAKTRQKSPLPRAKQVEKRGKTKSDPKSFPKRPHFGKKTQKIQTNVLILLDFWGWICYTARVATKIAANSVPVSVKETRGRSVPIAL